MNDREYAYLKRAIQKELGFDANAYRAPQIRRRLTTFIDRRTDGNVTMLCHRLRTNDRLREEIRRLLTINVSEFFRDPHQFELLEQLVLPELAERASAVRIWSAGCSHGEEPYTLAILCQEAHFAVSVDILATDIDDDALARARSGGPYSLGELRKVPPRFLKRYFAETAEGHMVSDEIRRSVRVLRHDVVGEDMNREFDLIVCRNVTIYFSPEVKSALIRKFWRSLRDGGYLFIGGAEALIGPEASGFTRFGGNFYQKTTETGATQSRRLQLVAAAIPLARGASKKEL